MASRKKRSTQSPPSLEPKVETVTMGRAGFQALHAAARALFRQGVSIDNHSAESLVYLQLLDAAIDEGHTALGTQRSAADQYIHLVRGMTEAQLQNAHKILESEGLLQTDE